MKRIYSFTSVLMIVLLLFPLVEKVKHDFAHFNETHCSKKDIHFCAVEHTCPICDYVHSPSATPPNTKEQMLALADVPVNFSPVFVSNTVTPPKFELSLRGPPVYLV